MTQHTPGPWKLRHEEPKPDYKYPYMRLEAGDSFADGFYLTGIVSAADAHLIAAAPDLLYAASAAIAECAEALTPTVRVALRQAIAKAKGE